MTSVIAVQNQDLIEDTPFSESFLGRFVDVRAS